MLTFTGDACGNDDHDGRDSVGTGSSSEQDERNDEEGAAWAVRCSLSALQTRSAVRHLPRHPTQRPPRHLILFFLLSRLRSTFYLYDHRTTKTYKRLHLQLPSRTFPSSILRLFPDSNDRASVSWSSSSSPLPLRPWVGFRDSHRPHSFAGFLSIRQLREPRSSSPRCPSVIHRTLPGPVYPTRDPGIPFAIRSSPQTLSMK